MDATRFRTPALVVLLSAALVLIVSCGDRKGETAKAKAVAKAKPEAKAKAGTKSQSAEKSKTTADRRESVGSGGRWTLEDGASRSMRIGPGRYRVELTAAGDRARVDWSGGDQPSSGEVKQYSTVVRFSQPGEMMVSNPKALGYGESSVVTVKVTRLGA